MAGEHSSTTTEHVNVALPAETTRSPKELTAEEQEEEEEAAAALDEIVARARARQRSKFGGAKRMIRLTDRDVGFIMSWGTGYLGEALSVDWYEWHAQELLVEEKERPQHEKMVNLIGDEDDDVEERQARAMRELCERGYAEAEDTYLGDDEEYVDESNEWGRIQWERLEAASASRRLARMKVAVKESEEEQVDDDDDDSYSESKEKELGDTVWTC